MAVILPALPIGTKKKLIRNIPVVPLGGFHGVGFLAENAPAVLEFSRATGHLAARISTTRIQSSKTPRQFQNLRAPLPRGWASCWSYLASGQEDNTAQGLAQQRMMYRARPRLDVSSCRGADAQNPHPDSSCGKAISGSLPRRPYRGPLKGGAGIPARHSCSRQGCADNIREAVERLRLWACALLQARQYLPGPQWGQNS